MRLKKILLLTVFFSLIISCSEKKDFNSNEWKNWTESEANPSTRWSMHKNLLKTYELKGMEKTAVLDLLGKPNSETDDKYHYLLGYTGRGVNTGTMMITIKNNVVTDVKVTDG